MMKTITISYPEETGLNEFDIKMMLAAKLFDTGKLSSGQAAEMVGLSKVSFLELLGKYGVSVFGYTAEELESDFINAKGRNS